MVRSAIAAKELNNDLLLFVIRKVIVRCVCRQEPSSRAGLPYPHEYRHEPDRGQSEHNGRRLHVGGCGRCVWAATLLPVGDGCLQKTLISHSKNYKMNSQFGANVQKKG